MIANLDKILADHALWLKNEGGQRADLQGANLQGANLQGADLQGADLQRANLQGANLRWANLRWADLQGANLRWANLRWANLQRANLQGADLRWADLDFSCLPLWCGGQFKADNRICQQLLAHSLRICELSECGGEEMLTQIRAYVAGWHRESEFNKRG